MRKWNVNTLCTLALLTAMMVLLSLTLAVRTDYFKLTFGLMPTTVIWILPPAIRAVVVGLAAVQLRKTGVPLERRPALCYIVCIAGAVLTTTGNTLGMWLDSLVYHTSFSAALFIAPARYVSGVVTAAVIATLSMPLVHLLRRSGVLNEVRHDGP